MDGRPDVGAPGSARVPDGFDVDLTFARDPWQFGSGEAVEVDVLVDGAESGRVVAELGHEAVAERRDDGAVVVRLSVSDVGALVLWVLDLLDHAEVLRPESVRAAVVERLEASVAAARSDPTGSTAAGPPTSMTVLVGTVPASADSWPSWPGWPRSVRPASTTWPSASN